MPESDSLSRRAGSEPPFTPAAPARGPRPNQFNSTAFRVTIRVPILSW
jgi:hypothetical protein